MKRKRWEYAMYKGEDCLAIGTSNEICKQMNIKMQTFRYYRTNAYKDRINNRVSKDARIIIKLED